MDRTAVPSNKHLEDAYQVIVVPKREDVQALLAPEEYMNRLNQLENPTDRLKTLFKAYFNIFEQPTHEALWIRSLTVTSFLGGGLIGSLANSRGIHDYYIRKHNASVFQNQFVGNRHFWDTLVFGLVPKALNYGFKTSLLTTSASFLCISSVTYRGKLYAPDWIVGFTTIGALSRLWLGSRAMLAGALFGGAVSIFAFGIVKSFELASGYSVAQIRLLNHTEWVKKREAMHIRYLESHRDHREDQHQLAEPDSFKFDIEG